MAKLSRIRTDTSAEASGKWFDYAAGIRLCIASTGSPEFRKAARQVLRPHTGRIRMDAMDDEEQETILRKVYARHILVDWENIEDDETNEAIEYSAEKALEFLRDPELADLWDFVVTTSGGRRNFLKDLVEDTEGN